MKANYDQMTVVDLRQLTKERGLAASYKYKKHELISWLEDDDKQNDAKDTTSSALEEQRDVSQQVEEGTSSASTRQQAVTFIPPSKRQDQLNEIKEEREGVGREETADDASSLFTVDKAKEEEPEKKKKASNDSEDNYRHDLPYTVGTLEVMQDGYGFLRSETEDGQNEDYYVPASHIKRFQLRTGDLIEGIVGDNHDKDKYAPIIYVNSINGTSPITYRNRVDFDDLTPVYADERIRLERKSNDISTRIVDLVAPIGKGQRGLIVSPPKAGKTSLLKAVAHSVEQLYPEIYLFILLIDERPEEVTDFERSVNLLRDAQSSIRTEVISSTFDKPAQNHVQTAEALLDRVKRLVESGQDVMILLDSLTRLSRAYNITTSPSGRTLSGGLDPVALYPPKRFFGSARNIDGLGSLTILASCLKDTGSRMDDMIYEEFKGTGNMEVHLSRDLSELRIFPAIDIFTSGTRRDDLLLDPKEQRTMYEIRKKGRGQRQEETYAQFVKLIGNTESNDDFCTLVLHNAEKNK